LEYIFSLLPLVVKARNIFSIGAASSDLTRFYFLFRYFRFVYSFSRTIKLSATL
jgi:hypothetical protein